MHTVYSIHVYLHMYMCIYMYVQLLGCFRTIADNVQVASSSNMTIVWECSYRLPHVHVHVYMYVLC